MLNWLVLQNARTLSFSLPAVSQAAQVTYDAQVTQGTQVTKVTQVTHDAQVTQLRKARNQSNPRNLWCPSYSIKKRKEPK